MSKIVGYYISVQKITEKGNRVKFEHLYDSPIQSTKKDALFWASRYLRYPTPLNVRGFLMRAHIDPIDDEIKGWVRNVKRRVRGGPPYGGRYYHALVFEDEWFIDSNGDDGYTYDVSLNGTLINKR